MSRHGAPESPTLAAEAKEFWSNPSPKIIAAPLAAALAIRLALGGWTVWDAVIPAVQIALQPFVEWLIHVYLLHWKPRQILGKKRDPYVAKKHRMHHRDPRLVKWIFVPEPVLYRLIPGAVVLYLLVFRDVRYGLTATVSGLAIFLTYEWMHFLIHSRYKPKTRLYRYIWRAHRLHHYKNENYWFGVTMPVADHVLNTFPEKNEVETSPTCRTLGEDATV
ncbi:MAG: sterol desaturase family protein [Actinobacteria bacterium]|nr:sterol desaturase family protein [Actinomycetota bacterium]